MGGVIDDVKGIFGKSKADKAIKAQESQANIDREYQQKLFERQFGPVNDALMSQIMGMLGYEKRPVKAEAPRIPGGDSVWSRIVANIPSTPDGQEEYVHTGKSPFMDRYKGVLREEIESGVRPGEEAARAALLDRVRANPMGMSNQAYGKSLKDIVLAGGKARGEAYRSGMGSAELLPLNTAMSFLGRTPISPVTGNAGFTPNYNETGVEDLVTTGEGLYGLVKGAKDLYSKYLSGGPDMSKYIGGMAGSETDMLGGALFT